jgi:hypothetical protein
MARGYSSARQLNKFPEERTVFGTHEDAKITARSMINAWLKKQSVLKE